MLTPEERAQFIADVAAAIKPAEPATPAPAPATPADQPAAAPPTPAVPPAVQAPEHKGMPSMTYSKQFEETYAKKT